MACKKKEKAMHNTWLFFCYFLKSISIGVYILPKKNKGGN